MVARFPVEDVIDSANCHILEVGMYLAAATVDGDAAAGGSSSSDQNSSGGEHDGRHSKVAQAQQEPDYTTDSDADSNLIDSTDSIEHDLLAESDEGQPVVVLFPQRSASRSPSPVPMLRLDLIDPQSPEQRRNTMTPPEVRGAAAAARKCAEEKSAWMASAAKEKEATASRCVELEAVEEPVMSKAVAAARKCAEEEAAWMEAAAIEMEAAASRRAELDAAEERCALEEAQVSQLLLHTGSLLDSSPETSPGVFSGAASPDYTEQPGHYAATEQLEHLGSQRTEPASTSTSSGMLNYIF